MKFLCCCSKVRKYSVNQMRLLLTFKCYIIYGGVENNREDRMRASKAEVGSLIRRHLYKHWINQLGERNCFFAFQTRKYVISAHLIVPAVSGYRSGKDHTVTIPSSCARSIQELQVDWKNTGLKYHRMSLLYWLALSVFKRFSLCFV